MVRKTTSRDCPPLLKEKWEAAKSKSDKGEVFQLFIGCGGNVGRMVAVESAVHRDEHRVDEGRHWLTADDLLTKFHGKQHLVDDLTSRAESRPHPDFPRDPLMRQYRVAGDSKETLSRTSVRERSLHWTSMLTGQVALEMAQNVESLFAIGDSPSSSTTPSADVAAPKAKAKAKAKPKAKRVVTPVDTRKQYITALGSRCMEFISIMMEIRAKLGSEAWTAGLRQMLDGERAAFETLHGKFVAMSSTEYTDAELAPLLSEFKERTNTAGQYSVAPTRRAVSCQRSPWRPPRLPQTQPMCNDRTY
jgi:hypothetical protein